jgi:hypothetical protein
VKNISLKKKVKKNQKKMKNFVMFLLVIVLLFTMVSCQKDQDTISSEPAPQISGDVKTSDPGESGAQLKASVMMEYPVSPRFGRPNSTSYLFKVYDPIGISALSVKLYDKATGNIIYFSLSYVGSYWILSTQISTTGWFDYRYVYTSSHANISTTTYAPLCTTRNTFTTCPSLISWPFGADGSSWTNRTVDINGNYQTWRGGEETKGTQYHYGYGWNEGTHMGSNECYADDWNRGTGSQDLGAILRSPLDGYIANFGTYNTSLGQSKYVAIVQESSDGNLYRFYVGHLQNYPNGLYIGKYMRAGIDQIGNLGASGASSPHAHTNMRKVTNGANTSVPFYFSAQ